MRRVVVVDDDATFREAATDLLEGQGFQVVGTAGDVAAARRTVARLRPDAILLDINLPDGDGYAFSAEITGGAQPPRVLLTSSDQHAGMPSALRDTGAAGFVSKTELGVTDLSRWLG